MDKYFSHAQEDRDLRGRLAGLMRRQRFAVEVFEIDLTRGGLGRRDMSSGRPWISSAWPTAR